MKNHDLMGPKGKLKLSIFHCHKNPFQFRKFVHLKNSNNVSLWGSELLGIYGKIVSFCNLLWIGGTICNVNGPLNFVFGGFIHNTALESHFSCFKILEHIRKTRCVCVALNSYNLQMIGFETEEIKLVVLCCN
jgi:hypothetical protein